MVTEPIGQDPDGNDVYLHELWPTSEEIGATIAGSVTGELFRGRYADVFTGDETWRALDTPAGDLYALVRGSTYVRRP